MSDSWDGDENTNKSSPNIVDSRYEVEEPSNLRHFESGGTLCFDDADWFLKTLEYASRKQLTEQNQILLEESQLRKTEETQLAVLFSDDATFLFSADFMLDCFVDTNDFLFVPGQVILRELILRLAVVFNESIEMKDALFPECLLRRALYFLHRVGLNGAKITSSQDRLFVLHVNDFSIDHDSFFRMVVSVLNVRQRAAS